MLGISNLRFGQQMVVIYIYILMLIMPIFHIIVMSTTQQMLKLTNQYLPPFDNPMSNVLLA